MKKLIINPYHKINPTTHRMQIGINDKVPTGFDPNDISGLTRWYDFSDQSTITLSTGDYISGVSDKTNGSTHYLHQSTAAKQPHLKQNIQNGLSVCQFLYDGSDTDEITDDASNILPVPTNDCTVFILAKKNTDSNNEFVSLDGNNEASGRRYLTHMPYSNWTTFYFDAGDTSTNRLSIDVGSAAETNNWKLLTHIKDTSGAGTNTLRLDSGTWSASGTSTAASTSFLTIGQMTADHYLAEILIYNRALTQAEYEQVEDYLNDKWNL